MFCNKRLTTSPMEFMIFNVGGNIKVLDTPTNYSLEKLGTNGQTGLSQRKLWVRTNKHAQATCNDNLDSYCKWLLEIES